MSFRMKKTIVALAIGVAVGLPIPGCKKSEDSKTTATASGDTVSKTDDRVELKLKWPVGNRYIQRMDIVQSSEMTVPQAPQPVKQDVTMGGRSVMTFDSKGEAGDETRNPLAAMFRKMAGARILYLMDASNQVERV